MILRFGRIECEICDQLGLIFVSLLEFCEEYNLPLEFEYVYNSEMEFFIDDWKNLGEIYAEKFKFETERDFGYLAKDDCKICYLNENSIRITVNPKSKGV